MPLTDDYVFHAVFGRDTEESRAALIEILNIILERKQDPIRAIVIKNPIEIPDREADKESVMDIRAETESGELLDIEIKQATCSFIKTAPFSTAADSSILHCRSAKTMIE